MVSRGARSDGAVDATFPNALTISGLSNELSRAASSRHSTSKLPGARSRPAASGEIRRIATLSVISTPGPACCALTEKLCPASNPVIALNAMGTDQDTGEYRAIQESRPISSFRLYRDDPHAIQQCGSFHFKNEARDGGRNLSPLLVIVVCKAIETQIGGIFHHSLEDLSCSTPLSISCHRAPRTNERLSIAFGRSGLVATGRLWRRTGRMHRPGHRQSPCSPPTELPRHIAWSAGAGRKVPWQRGRSNRAHLQLF